MLNSENIFSIYTKAQAVWFFDYKGDPKAPHAELTSGLCSDGYVNSALVLCNPSITELLARELAVRLKRRRVDLVDWVVGSAYAAITFSYEVARQFGAEHGFVEKDQENPKRMVWKRFVIPAGAIVLQCEELITTLQTTMEVRRAIEEGNPNPVRFLPDVGTAIYRPAKFANAGIIDVISLFSREVQSWEPKNCPLCAVGSERVRPKQNWRQLIGK